MPPPVTGCQIPVYLVDMTPIPASVIQALVQDRHYHLVVVAAQCMTEQELSNRVTPQYEGIMLRREHKTRQVREHTNSEWPERYLP
jgi:hypothetical protein